MRSSVGLPALVLASLILLGAITALYYLAGQDATGSWTTNAVRNWDQYGLWKLHGKMVVNPGGYEALTRPEAYKGHRATSLYPVFAIERLFAWTGLGILSFHLAFTLAVFLATGFLLGRTRLAWIAAAVTALCPGYTLYPAQHDPNAIALYAVLPFAALALPILTKDTFSPARGMVLALLVLGYTLLNWTTVFGHAMMGACLLVDRRVSKQRLLLYAVISGLSIALVGGMAVFDKTHYQAPTGQTAPPQSAKHFLASYTWGTTGYGTDMTTVKAVVRLSCVNLMGLLPLILVCTYAALRDRGTPQRFSWAACLPFGVAILGIASMRNYFGHHPWMAAPMLLPGLVLSLRLMTNQPTDSPTVQAPAAAPIRYRPAAPVVFVAACFAYALLIVAVHRVYHTESLEFAALVREHTGRGDTIVLIKSLNGGMASETVTIGENTDRRVVVLDDLSEPRDVGSNAFVVATSDLKETLPLVATSAPPLLLSSPMVQHAMTWYATKIARRSAWDQHYNFAKGATFALYRLPSSHQPDIPTPAPNR
jgi:hypothetical protein